MTVRNRQTTTATPAPDERLTTTAPGIRGLGAALARRVRGGDLGSLPVVIGLVVIWLIFELANDRFLTPQNLSNLTLQIAPTGLMATGVVLVLLLGEIDLSVGSVSGVTGALMVVLTVRHGVPEVLGIAAAVVFGAVIGALHGTVFARIGVPAFVVTLAGLIGWEGLQLYLLGKQGTINIPYDGTIAQLSTTMFVPAIGWAIAVVIIAAYLGVSLRNSLRRARGGLPHRGPMEIGARTGALAIGVCGSVAILNAWQGVPLALLIFAGFVVALDLILRRTRYGRAVFAVGGGIEAARRAGIKVDLVRVSVFMIASTLAAVGGVMAASRGFSVGQSSGGSDILLDAIAAAVIGGTSLFGGRGSTYSALLGMLVIGSIESGLELLQLNSSVRFMVTGAVLLGAVVIDALSRRSRRASGRS